MNIKADFKYFSLSLVWSWLFLFALLPLSLIVIVSFMHDSNTKLFEFPFTLMNYLQLNNPLYLRILKKSLSLAGLATFFCLVLGYPFAFIIARMQNRFKNFLILL